METNTIIDTYGLVKVTVLIYHSNEDRRPHAVTVMKIPCHRSEAETVSQQFFDVNSGIQNPMFTFETAPEAITIQRFGR